MLNETFILIIFRGIAGSNSSVTACNVPVNGEKITAGCNVGDFRRIEIGYDGYPSKFIVFDSNSTTGSDKFVTRNKSHDTMMCLRMFFADTILAKIIPKT